MEAILKRYFAINKEAAENQVTLVTEAYETLMASKSKIQALLEAQTAAVWTADGKSVELTAALRSKYRSAGAWVDAMQAELQDAAFNLNRAITETEDLDDRQRDIYRKRLESILGTESAEG